MSPYQAGDSCLCFKCRIIFPLLTSNMSSVPIACVWVCVCLGGGMGGDYKNGPSDSVHIAIIEVPCPVSEQVSLPAERQWAPPSLYLKSFIGARFLKKYPLFLKGFENGCRVLGLAIIIEWSDQYCCQHSTGKQVNIQTFSV